MRLDDRHHPGAADRSGYALGFDESFSEPDLHPDRWVAHYLPHWTTPERSAARYELKPGLLRLRIDADQPAWRTEDGEMRVSNIQTGAFIRSDHRSASIAIVLTSPSALFCDIARRVSPLDLGTRMITPGVGPSITSG